jgi:predicted NUDIX family phosphoesterase
MSDTTEKPEKIEEEVAELESRADALRDLLKYAPRPFVIEFAGTPKSGKSTSVESVRHFLNRHDFRVYLLSERAAVCPIPMKGHLFFNTWCASSMLAELLANIDTESDIIVVDRGLFDALVWLRMQENRGELTGYEARTFETFLLLDRWRSLIDLVVVMNVSADDALARENAQRITRKTGSIMTGDVLATLSRSVNDAVSEYGKNFKRVLVHNTGGEDVRESGVKITNEILDCLEQFLNPKILAVPREYIERLDSTAGGNFAPGSFEKALTCVKENGVFVQRDEAENRADLVQIVSAGVLVRDNRVFLFQRREADPKYRLYGKTTVWQGAHVQKETGKDFSDLLRETLQTRLSRNLFLSRVFQTNELGYCWDAKDPISSRHLGMMYSVTIDNPHTAADLRKKAFKRKRGHSLVGEFVPWEELKKRGDDLNLEPWSQTLLDSQSVQ